MAESTVSESQRLNNFLDILTKKKQGSTVATASQSVDRSLSGSPADENADQRSEKEILLSGERIFHHAANFSTQESRWRQEVADLKAYCSQLDVMAMCFHGLGRSAAVVDIIDGFNATQKRELKADNIGLDTLASQVHPNIENEDALVEALVDALLSAQSIAFFLESHDDSRNRVYLKVLKKLYAVMREEERTFNDGSRQSLSKKKFFNMNVGDPFSSLFMKLMQ